MGIGILGVGMKVPKTILKNSTDFVAKTGIRERRIVSPEDTASALSAEACIVAMRNAGIQPHQIGLLICCTFCGDYVFPATACKILDLIDAKNAGGFDILANCTGFQVGLSTASDKMANDASIQYALVVGVTVQSRYLGDVATEMFYGDGAGAVVLGRVPKGYGILSSDLFCNTDVYESVRLRSGTDHIEMNGLDVWKQVIQNQPKVINRALSKAGETLEDVNFFIFHQANVKLIEYLMGKMKLPLTQTHITADRYGNTAEASLPITLCGAILDGKIKRGDLVVISGVGAGFIFGATVERWY